MSAPDNLETIWAAPFSDASGGPGRALAACECFSLVLAVVNALASH